MVAAAFTTFTCGDQYRRRQVISSRSVRRSSRRTAGKRAGARPLRVADERQVAEGSAPAA